MKYKKHHYNCSVCGSDSFLKIYGVSIFNVSVCRTCGVVCLNPRMDEKGYREYYQTQYFGNYLSKVKIEKSYDDIEEDPRAVKIFNDLKQYTVSKSRIVEIGCGEGKNLITFKKNGFNCLTGLEVNSDCCKRLQRFYDIRCINKTLFEFAADFNEEKFDCVILSHILEHFVEPKKALETISNIIKPEGLIYIMVPFFYRYNNLFSQFCIPHTFYFSNATLEALLRNSNFMVEKKIEQPDSEEIVLIARKTKEHLTSVKNNEDEFRKVLFYLKKNKLIYIKMKARRIAEEFIIIIFGENIYLSVRNFLKKFKKI